ncbi:MAG TPA: 4-alpha-glucanotransferase, partial [Atribacterota bacterium]|nr:4-alpha-glucanotransferase [Atribacterota bacterium]
MNNRGSGLLIPIFCLPSRFGIGDLGLEAYRFADLLSKNNQHYWQILPLNPTEIKHGNSPYHSCSAFAGNFILISPELLYRDG